MANEQIQIEVVLDDGSVKKGFARIEKAGEDSASSLSSVFGSSAAKISASIVAVGVALKKTLDFALAGEKLNTLNAQFDLLAKREGIASDMLRAGLEQAGKGLISVSDLLQTANGAMAILGKNAEKLPQILDLATKSAAIFGGTAEERFNDLVYAIETGNQKALKNAGIIIDADKVYKSFAASIGTTAGELTNTQKQAAILDATLAKGAQTFAGLESNLSPMKKAIAEFKVAFGEIVDNVMSRFANFVGPAVAATFKTIAEAMALPKTRTLQTQFEGASDRVKNLTTQLTELQAKLAERQEGGMLSGLGSETVIKNQIASVTAALKEQRGLVQMLAMEKQAAADLSERAGSKEADAARALVESQKRNIELRKGQVAQAIYQNEMAELTSKQNLLQYENDYNARREQMKILTDERLKLLDQETKFQILETERNFSLEAGFTVEQREAMITSIKEAAAQRRKEIETNANEEFLKQAADTKARLGAIQAAMNTIVAQGATKFAQSLFKAGNFFENFANGLLEVVADQVIQLGQALVVQGLAMEAFITAINSLLPGSGAAAAAAGLGLIIFGTALKSAIGAGGGGGGAEPAGGGIGGGVSVPAGGTFTEEAPLEKEKPGTKIEVNISGDVLDSDETGLRIVNLINSAFDKQGVEVRGGV
jgi:hypothetical protein